MTLDDGARRRIAIALVSASIVVLQIAVTRILSVILWYHWAFFAISLAMLGVGAPGVWFALRPPGPDVLGRLLRFAAIALPLSVCAIIKGTLLFADSAIIFCMLCLLVPVVSLGAAVCVLLLEAEGPAVARLYAWDLLGACVGAAAVIPLMTRFPTPELAAGLAFVPLALSFWLDPKELRRPAVIAVSLLGLLLWREPFQIRASKVHVELGGASPIEERWSPIARITVFPQPFGISPSTPWGWGFGRVPPEGPVPRQYWLEQDGSAGSPITNLVGSPAELGYLLHDVTSVGYQSRTPKQVAIVGCGGGRDILTALGTGTKAIDAIELNAATVRLLRGALRGFSGGVYDLPGVNTIVGEGRSAITHSKKTYDLIQISLIDSWAASAAGAYTLSEANLYTVEAFRLYFSHLTEQGVVSTSRWMGGSFQLEVPRLLFTVHEALRQAGIARPRDHIALVQGGAIGTVLMAKRPFSPDDIERLRQISDALGFDLHLPVSMLPPPAPALFNGAFDGGPEKFAPPGFDLSPPTDDKPFFFQMLRPFSQVTADQVMQYGPISEGVVVLRRLMTVLSVVTLVLFFAPFAFTRRYVPREKGFWQGSLFFVAIGLGFMLVEVSWVQRFILYLGHPSHALTVALAGMLLGAGIGSMISTRVGLERARRFGLALPAFLVLVNLALTPLFEATLGWALPLRVVLAALVLVPSGFMMGFCFPLGMIRFGDTNKAWYFALNGAAGVLASIASLVFFMEFGFKKVAFVGVAAYVLAWLLSFGKPDAHALARRLAP